MRYCLVASFTKDSYSHIENLQRNACKKYKLYKRISNLHVSLQMLEEPNLEKLDSIIKKELSCYKKFKVQVNKSHLTYNSPSKTVSLKVENRGYINRIVRNTNEKLHYGGFKFSMPYKDVNLFIPLANGNYQIKNILEHESNDIHDYNDEKDFSFLKIESFDLCKLVGHRKIHIIKKYPLRDF
ncbi:MULTISPECIES: 2'-5' RNA ligase [Clostridium]|uniref:2'-5' RNA ligase n=1 Tax=Clostridium TaxID=1485 RepID=UPI000826CE1C|nr:MULTISPECIES: 2'-5' RNA ligase [Clostridium]PJI08566.1 2'-5' RNA ligase [Clostridium sp. CT7]